VLNDHSRGWFLGVKRKSDFFKQATFLREGYPDGGGFLIKRNCFNLRVDQLEMRY